MFKEGPPARDDVPTSRTVRRLGRVNTLTTSGMIAPAASRTMMIVESFHHRVSSRTVQAGTQQVPTQM